MAIKLMACGHFKNEFSAEHLIFFFHEHGSSHHIFKKCHFERVFGEYVVLFCKFFTHKVKIFIFGWKHKILCQHLRNDD